MATATLTSQLTDVSLDPGAPTAIGTGNAEASETVIHRQGSNCAAVGHSGSLGPVSPTAISEFRGSEAAAAITRSGTHLHLWMRDLYPVRAKNVGGVSGYISDGTNEVIYYADGSDKGYFGKWFHWVLALDNSVKPAADLGTDFTGNITRVGCVGNISATKGESFLENSYFDAIRSGTAGQGITFTGGTSGDRLTLNDCALADTAAYGLLDTDLTCEGPITFGASGQTTYLQDSLKSIKMRDFSVGTGLTSVGNAYYKVSVVTGTLTDFNVPNLQIIGVSRTQSYEFTAATLTGSDSFDCEGLVHVFANTITYGANTTSKSHTFTESVTIVPNGITLTDPIFNNSDRVTLTATNDAISGGTTNLHNTLTGVAFVLTNSLTKISSHGFTNTAGVGHAIEINTAGTYSFSANTFTGYGADASNDAAIYNNSGGAVTINIVGGGDTPTVRNGASATTTVNNSVTVKVSGVTEGTPITVIANETVGTVTIGDVILSDFADNNGEASTTIAYEGAFDPSGLDVISRARNQGVAVAAIADDGGIFTNETTNASSNTTNDMTLLPAVPALNDAYYYGHNEQFSEMKQDVSTVLTFSAQPTIVWEYWNGTAWIALSGVVDSTNGFETAGQNKITFTLPSNWATTTINAQGPLYYVRARLSVVGTITQVPIGAKATLDTSRYLPYAANRVIVSGTGLSDIANWTKDTISQF